MNTIIVELYLNSQTQSSTKIESNKGSISKFLMCISHRDQEAKNIRDRLRSMVQRPVLLPQKSLESTRTERKTADFDRPIKSNSQLDLKPMASISFKKAPTKLPEAKISSLPTVKEQKKVEPVSLIPPKKHDAKSEPSQLSFDLNSKKLEPIKNKTLEKDVAKYQSPLVEAKPIKNEGPQKTNKNRNPSPQSRHDKPYYDNRTEFYIQVQNRIERLSPEPIQHKTVHTPPKPEEPIEHKINYKKPSNTIKSKSDVPYSDIRVPISHLCDHSLFCCDRCGQHVHAHINHKEHHKLE